MIRFLNEALTSEKRLGIERACANAIVLLWENHMSEIPQETLQRDIDLLISVIEVIAQTLEDCGKIYDGASDRKFEVRVRYINNKGSRPCEVSQVLSKYFTGSYSTRQSVIEGEAFQFVVNQAMPLDNVDVEYIIPIDVELR